MFLNSAGRLLIKEAISSGLLTSSWCTQMCTPDPTSAVICAAMACRRSRRRAVRMSLRLWGEVRANSKAVLRPMPDEAPVIRIVLPWRFLAVEVRGGMFWGLGLGGWGLGFRVSWRGG
jgi:hypothetical protein